MERLRDLEASGKSFSRNSDYAFYQQPANGRARRLRRFLRELAAEIGTHRGTISLTQDGTRFRLIMVAPAPGYRRTVMLDAEEVAYLRDLVPTLP